MESIDQTRKETAKIVEQVQRSSAESREMVLGSRRRIDQSRKLLESVAQRNGDRSLVSKKDVADRFI